MGDERERQDQIKKTLENLGLDVVVRNGVLEGAREEGDKAVEISVDRDDWCLMTVIKRKSFGEKPLLIGDRKLVVIGEEQTRQKVRFRTKNGAEIKLVLDKLASGSDNGENG